MYLSAFFCVAFLGGAFNSREHLPPPKKPQLMGPPKSFQDRPMGPKGDLDPKK